MKRLLNIGFAVLVLTAGMALSGCRDGNFVGTGGDGNFVIMDRTTANELNKKYIEVECASSPPMGYKTPPGRLQIKGRKLSAPLYDANGDKYTGSDNFTSNLTVHVYANNTAPSPIVSDTFTVKFYGGSGLVDWVKPLP
jgi:hypothetical protein